MFLYIITNLINSKQYVGITINPSQRINAHFNGNGSILIKQAIAKYGVDNFRVEILLEDSKDKIQLLEILTIQTLETRAPFGYNLSDGGEGTHGYNPGRRQKKHSEVTKQKISKSLMGRKQTPETVEKRRKKLIGKKRTEAVKARISASHTGMKHTPETRAKIRLLKTGLCDSEETKKKKSQNSGVAKPVLFNGVKFSCLSKAAKAQGIPESTLARWFRKWSRKNCWPKDCKYLTK